MPPRKKSDDAGTSQVTERLHEAQAQGYLGSRPEAAPSFASQTVAGVTSGQNVDEAPTPDLGEQAGENPNT